LFAFLFSRTGTGASHGTDGLQTGPAQRTRRAASEIKSSL